MSLCGRTSRQRRTDPMPSVGRIGISPRICASAATERRIDPATFLPATASRRPLNSAAFPGNGKTLPNHTPHVSLFSAAHPEVLTFYQPFSASAPGLRFVRRDTSRWRDVMDTATQETAVQERQAWPPNRGKRRACWTPALPARPLQAQAIFDEALRHHLAGRIGRGCGRIQAGHSPEPGPRRSP